MGLINSALNFIAEEEVKAYDYGSRAIGLYGLYSLKALGWKEPRTDWINPWERYRNKQTAIALYPPEVAKSILEVVKHRSLPLWCKKAIDLDTVRLAADG